MKKLLTAVFLALTLVFVSVYTSACAQKELEVPSNISIDDSYWMSWDDVKNSHGYVVSITDPSGETEQYEAKITDYSLSDLDMGDYEIRIKAVGSDGYADSAWTEIIYFHKDYENGCIYEKINNDTEYRLIGYGTSSGVVDVGDLYRGKPVTEIGDKAFRNSRAESVIIGKNVRSIGESAFYNAGQMTSVTIPDSVTYIGPSAFQACYALDNVVIPDSITSISDNLFNFCRSLTNIQLPEVDSIGVYAFANCSALTEFDIPDTVQTIGEAAFLNDSALVRVSIGDSVSEIGTLAFGNCESLTTVEFSQAQALKTIGESAFESCATLKTAALPDGLETIGNGAFRNCSSLADVTIPESVTRIGQFAFLMTEVYNTAKAQDETYVYVGSWLVELVSGKESKLTVAGDERTPANLRDENFVAMRSDITGIADAVFYVCSSLQRVYLPDSVIYIGNSAFSSCENLWYFEASDNSSLRSIDTAAFIGCDILRTIYLGKALENVGAYAFYNCSVLENNSISSIIPDTVTHIGMLAFYGTTLYDNVDEYGVVYAGNWVIGYEKYDYAMAYMYSLAADDEEAANSLVSSLSKVTYIKLDSEVKGIADFAFYGHINLEQVDSMSSAQYIGEAAFYGCQSLSTVNLNGSMSKIEDFTFYGCDSLFKVTLPPMISSVGRAAFYNCTQISEISNTSRRLEKIGDFAFYNCINLPSMNFNSGLTDIGRYAFYNCMTLGEILLPDTLQQVGDCAFYQCSSATSLELGQGLVSIGSRAFGNCTGLTEIVIPASVDTIGDHAFAGCAQVVSLDLGTGVESIGDYAFAGLASLENVVIPASVRSVGNYAFRGCTALTSVLLNGKVEQIGTHAFFGDNRATLYSDSATVPGRWEEYWNSSFRPVIMNCRFSEDGSYIVSVTVTEDSLFNVNGSNTVSAPVRDGYTFAGWAVSEGGSVEYAAEEIGSVPAGTTLYAVWQQA